MSLCPSVRGSVISWFSNSVRLLEKLSDVDRLKGKVFCGYLLLTSNRGKLYLCFNAREPQSLTIQAFCADFRGKYLSLFPC